MTNRSPDLRSLHSQLMHLAGEMVHGQNMPNEFWEDRKWYTTTPLAERRAVMKDAERANEQCREWAARVRLIADQLPLGRRSAEQRAYEQHEEAALSGGYGK